MCLLLSLKTSRSEKRSDESRWTLGITSSFSEHFNRKFNVQEALEGLGRRLFYKFYESFVSSCSLGPRGVGVVLVCLGEHVDKGSEDCQIGRYSLLKLDLKKNCST